MSEASSQDQFLDLLSRHQSQIFGYIFAAVRNVHDAEELYQEVSLVLWRKFADYEPDSNFARWACQVAKHKILHFQHDRRRGLIYFGEEALDKLAEVHISKSSVVLQQHQELLAECVNELSPSDKELVDQCYSSQDTVRQIAAKLQRAPQTLYNSLSRIRRVLLDCIHLKLMEEQK
jgi:RNA polymerase sigma-70 factor, ECF subfamily